VVTGAFACQESSAPVDVLAWVSGRGYHDDIGGISRPSIPTRTAPLNTVQKDPSITEITLIMFGNFSDIKDTSVEVLQTDRFRGDHMGKGINATEEKEAQEALKESEAKFRLLMEQAPVDTQIFGMDGTLLQANKAWEEMWETSRENIVGKYNVLRDPQAKELGILPYFQKAFAGEPQLIPDFQYDPKKIGFPGRIRWIRSRVYPIKDRNGIVRNVILTNEDISDHKRMEEALRKSEHRLRGITEAALDAIFCKDRNRRYTFVNPAVEKLFGLPASDLIGKTPEELYDQEGIATVNEVDDKAFAGEYVNVTRTLNILGEPHYFHVIQGPLRDCDGEVVEISGIVRDITEQTRAEKEKEVLEEKLIHAQKMEAVGTLAGGIAHEFNNLLAGVVGYAELMLLDLPPDSKRRTDLLQILKAGKRGKALTSQILTYSRPGDTDRKPIDLAELFVSALKNIRMSVPQNIAILYENQVVSPTVMADPTQIHQVLENLCLNAIHAMRDVGGTLRIDCTEEEVSSEYAALDPELKPGKYVKLSVHDTGHGIDKQFIDRVFEPFFTTKKTGEGTGLGLSVVHGIVENHGGTIRVQSSLGKGTTFEVLLSLQAMKAEPPQQTHPATLPTGSGRILFVDDEDTIIAWALRVLSRMGYDVVTKSNGAEALRAFQVDPANFDLVITDLTMPGMTGQDLCSNLRDIRRDIPIIMCTGYGDSIDRGKASKLGGMDVLAKPVSIADLASAIEKAMSQRESPDKVQG
jgi:PAS domain S-box-containing protein